jgi:thiamine pyrophosphokinase
MGAPTGGAGEASAVLVFAGGDPPDPAVDAVLATDALVIGADSGIEHAHRLGRRVDVAVGDFDSVAPEHLTRAEAGGARIERHAVDKDATDLELALDLAVAVCPRTVTVVGGHGGRLDHTVANLQLLAAPRYAGVALDAWFGAGHITVTRDHARVEGPVGSFVSLLAVDGPADGVSTSGLRFPLTDARLVPGSTLGVSNELVDPVAEVTVAHGVVLVIEPDGLGARRGG